MGSLSANVSLPTLNGAKWFSGSESDRQEFAHELLESLKRHGFVKLVNHGISDDAVREMYKWNKEFFDLSVETKSGIEHKPTALQPQRGWSCVGVERSAKLNWGRTPEQQFLSQGLKDAKEHLDMGAPDDGEYSNQWPRENEAPGFRKCMESHYNACLDMSFEIMSALELSLKVPHGTLSENCRGKASELRISHYPSISVTEMEQGNVSRIWPHTDLGVLTLLFQDEVGGLEIEDREEKGSFFPVQRETWNEVVINVSETLERWTNGELPSGLHQVTVPPELKGKDDSVLSSRFSSAFFIKADRTAEVGVLPPFLLNGEKKRYESMTALEFHLHRLTSAY